MSKKDASESYGGYPQQNTFPAAGYSGAPNNGYQPSPSAPPPSYQPNEHGLAQTYMTPSTQMQPSHSQPAYDHVPEETHEIQVGGGISNRKSFITKVYAILGVQLLVTFVPIVCVCTIAQEEVQDWVEDNSSTVTALLWVAIACQFTILFGLACCCTSLAKKTPWNYLILGTFTICETFMLSIICVYFDTNIVLVAVAGTALITVLVSVFSAFTKFDFTKAIHVMGIILLIWILLSWMFAIFNWSDVVYGLIGCTIFTIFLAIDTQMILGGKRYEVSEEDYIFAALALYMDIINIFLYLLRILQGVSD